MQYGKIREKKDKMKEIFRRKFFNIFNILISQFKVKCVQGFCFLGAPGPVPQPVLQHLHPGEVTPARLRGNYYRVTDPVHSDFR